MIEGSQEYNESLVKRLHKVTHLGTPGDSPLTGMIEGSQEYNESLVKRLHKVTHLGAPGDSPLTGMIEGSQEYNESLVKRLHKVCVPAPFLLRRLKVDVEKQMPKKYEHVLRCRLSPSWASPLPFCPARCVQVCPAAGGPVPVRAGVAGGAPVALRGRLVPAASVPAPPGGRGRRPRPQPPNLHEGEQDAAAGAEGGASGGSAPPRPSPRPRGRGLAEPRPLRAKPRPHRASPAPLLVQAPPLVTLSHAPSAGPAPLVTTQGAGLNLGLGLALAPPRATPTLLAPPPGGPAHALPAASLATPTPAGGPAPVATPTPNMGKGAGPAPPPPVGGVATFALPQRLLLAPDMQARLPSGEVVSLGQLAALAQHRPSPPGGVAKTSPLPPAAVATPPAASAPPPLTLQLQGSKVTLGPAPPLRHLALARPPGRGLA
ncbi:E1A-binding protein p400-like, partial [Camarhynchus parvulus]|uniref:E1A-binding protein p400-like n=1 Tax=Geospiza parvula TaxID=87175 RepID=UPI001237FD98